MLDIKIILKTSNPNIFLNIILFKQILSILLFAILFFSSVSTYAQQKDTINKSPDSVNFTRKITNSKNTIVSGKVSDALTGDPLPYITVAFVGSTFGNSTNLQGFYTCTAPNNFPEIRFSGVGYKSITLKIKEGSSQVINLKIFPNKNQLKEVKIISNRKKKPYRNKNNPSVELIQEVIKHKEENRKLNSEFLQYKQYEKIRFSFFDLPQHFLNGKFFKKYKFLLDTTSVINDSVKTSLPLYMSEKLSYIFSRKSPFKQINIVKALKKVNFSSFIDSSGLDVYVNRLYGNPDIYENNIFILTNQFLSPIADHAPSFYKFFITDTLNTESGKLIEISFTPKTLGDLLFEGRLYITMDGRFAVKSVYLMINNHININFVQRMEIHQDFEQYPNGKYYLVKNEVQSDFGINKIKGAKVFGVRSIILSNYETKNQKSKSFYEGKSEQISIDNHSSDGDYWGKNRLDTMPPSQEKIYRNIDSLVKMPSFKKTIWLSTLISGGYANFGPFQFGPVERLYSFNNLEGFRPSLGGRTTSIFNNTFYLEGYGVYGFKDQIAKYYLAGILSLNKNPYWKYPNNYFKVSYQFDTDIPGQNFLIDKAQSLLSSFTRGSNNLFQYNKIFRLDYIKDLENHVSYDISFKHWSQKPAGTLQFIRVGDSSVVQNLTTSEIDLGFRFAPHEKIFQGTENRHTIPSKNPILNFQINYGIKGLLKGSFDYLNLSANLYKRFYLSQLGFTDITLLGGTVLGKVPFPYLSILPANQTYIYSRNSYNMMNFLEFVSDHYIGLDVTHAFGGFLLNKVPLIKSLKWREYLSLKSLYGGLRNENNPSYSSDILKFPVNQNGIQATYPLGKDPYFELGAGVGNIFKVLRVDLIKRFNYLDHPGVSPLGLRFSFNPDL